MAHQPSSAGDSRVAVEPQFDNGSGGFHLLESLGEYCREFQLSTARVLPDPALCRAKAAGFGDYADCLVEHPFQCPHALGFGGGFLCRHPQRNEIVMRTSARDL